MARSNFIIRVPSGIKPKSVWAVSPDFTDFQKLGFTYNGGIADVTVKSLTAYTVVVLDYKNTDPLGIDVSEMTSPPVEIRPNPGHDFIDVLNNPEKSIPVKVYDILGNLVINTLLNNDRLYIGKLTPGLYIIRVKDSALRFLKE